ncbi:DNA adenine methylase [Kushneria phyllosphaerae]|uniref:Modification methylase DpnIIA n=1 Tax=Kushneria phyllosphaerae TaxID=2100822 RepID=A0A2R8CL12_9GAMM|nr:DNA adenine methylase [Kushneria phyllosphaerae]SPJ33588.1 Modification methylase DpnIIA [Kushneria phyllosphaerae]
MAQPIVPWIGGKRRLADKIFPLMPAHDCYVKPFAGGAALYFRRSQPAQVEVLNDINGDLVNLYRVVQNHLENFVRQFKWALSSHQVFEWLKMNRVEKLTDIQRAARLYYLQQNAFGARIEGQSFGTATTTRPQSYDRVFYLAPPYWQSEGYGFPFGLEEYEHMADLIG